MNSNNSNNNKKTSIEKMFASCILIFLAVMILLCVIMEYVCNIAFLMTSFRMFSLKHNYDDDININNNNINHISNNNNNNKNIDSDLFNPHLFVVMHGAGVYIRKEQNLNADVINVLPFGSIVKVISVDDYHKKREEEEDFIRITFPMNGWIIKKSVMKIMDFDNTNINTHMDNKNNKDVKKDMKEEEEKAMMKNVDIPRVNLITRPVSVTSAHECAHVCEHEALSQKKEALCGGWTYTITGECWLKDMRALNTSNHRKIVIPNRIVSGLNRKSTSKVYKPLDQSDKRDLITRLQQLKPHTKSSTKPLSCCNKMKETEITWKTVREGSYHPTSAISAATYVLKRTIFVY